MRVATWLAAAVLFLSLVLVGVMLGRRQGAAEDVDQRVRALQQAARRAQMAGNAAEVVRLMQRVPAGHPFAAEARSVMGKYLARLGRFQAAERAWKQALKLDPHAPEAGWQLLELYFILHRQREAEALALKLYHAEPDPRQRALYLLELIRQDHEALTPGRTATILETVLAVEPDCYQAKRVLGLSYVQIGRLHDGLQLVEEAAAMRPDDPDGWYTLSWCLCQSGRWQRLGQLWEQMPESARQEPRILRCRGQWAQAQGAWDEAARLYRNALDNDPYDRKAHYQLARVLRRLGAEQQAAEHERRAAELDRLREQLGTQYLALSNRPGAITAAECQQVSRLCRALGRFRQADCWDQESARRGGSGAEVNGGPTSGQQ